MPVIRAADSRRSDTPNGVMTTLASPTQGGTGLALWRVDLEPGKGGPRHAFDAEQIWTVLSGTATVDLDGVEHVVTSGDTVVLPAGAPRRITAGPDSGVAAIVAAPAGTRVYNPEGRTADEACDQAPKGAQLLLPPWVV
ncbi:cupin domain-containing protein [Saccharopolyspora taberi]|uniref:Cupin domain-containing protein n=1 Tax=Saccharopolyspora taberi TaxID=60895 RepID=A0ABN3VN73_9PSEU